ncbi:cohesin domain-containing protein [candidate division KSB1 bacterium]|nr:cohesin domain-containing protein [candidate division KSB1 bacterium]
MKNGIHFRMLTIGILSIGLFAAPNLLAQITILSEDFPIAIGTYVVTEDDTVDTIVVDLGLPGENQVWQLNQNFPGEFSHQLMVDKSETNFADDFPEANVVGRYAGKLGNLIHSYYFDDTEGLFYTYQLNSPDSLIVQGIGFDHAIVNFNNFKFSYSGPVDITPDLLLCNFPLRYGDSCKTVSFFSVKIDTVLYGNRTELITNVKDSTYSVVDGWGTLILPNASYECLRIKSYISLTEDIYAFGVLLSSKASRTINYNWVAEHYGIVARVMSHHGVVDDNFKIAKQISRLFRFNPELTFSISDTIGAPGDTLNLPVLITDATGLDISEIKMRINYDNTIFSDVGINTSGSLCEGWTTGAFANDSALAVELAGDSPLREAGVLFYLRVVVKATVVEDEKSVFEISEIELREKGPKIMIHHGQFTVKYIYNVMGKINYYSNNLAISSAELIMGDYKCSTDVNGQFALHSIPLGNHELTPAKMGDLKNSIGAFDASMILRYVVGLDTLSPYQKVAADVTGNGQVSALDASNILRYAVGLITKFPVGKDWRFIPSQFEISDDNWSQSPDCIRYTPLMAHQCNQNFKGIIYGDVSGYWSSANQFLAKKFCGVATFEFGEIRKESDSEFFVPVNIKSVADIVSVSLSISFDSNELTFRGIELFGFERQAIYFEKDDNLQIALAGAEKLNLSEEIFQLKFSMINPNRTRNTSIRLINVSVNENLIQINVLNGETQPGPVLPIQFALHQNFPNPFNSNTMITFAIAQSSHVKIEVFNTVGQRVKILLDENLERGEHRVQWDGKGQNDTDAPSGVYFYCLKSSTDTEARQIIQKMILIR